MGSESFNGADAPFFIALFSIYWEDNKYVERMEGIFICAGALVGLAVFYIRYFRLPVCITPVLCCSGVSVFLTLTGMAGLLLPGCYIVLGLG